MTMNFKRNGGGGTSDYTQLTNLPQVNGVTLTGNKTSADLGLMPTRNIDLKPTKDSQNFVFSGGVYEADEKIKSSVEGMDTVYTEDGTPVDLPSYDVIQDTEMQFLPTQDLHGYDKPWAGGAGKNKLKLEFESDTPTMAGMTFAHTESEFSINGTAAYTYQILSMTNVPIVEVGSNHTLSVDVEGSLGSSQISIVFRNNGEEVRRVSLTETRKSVAFQLESEYDEARFILEGFDVGSSYNYSAKIMLEQGSTATSYEPYSNICPISGQNNATLTDEYDNKYIASLGDTYYGGRVFFENSFYNQFWEYIASYNGETLPREWISDRDEYIAGTTPTIGAEVAYRLDTTIGHRISVTREPLSRGEITYNGSALYISYQKDNVIGECKKFTVDEIAKLGLPQPPTTDGTYHLECSVSSGIPTITWVLNTTD